MQVDLPVCTTVLTTGSGTGVATTGSSVQAASRMVSSNIAMVFIMSIYFGDVGLQF